MTDNQAKELKQVPNNKFWTAMALLALVLLVVSGILYSQRQQQLVKEYSIEGRLIINQYNEKQEFLSKEQWDLNEWLPKRNAYLENRLNTLLEYNDPALTYYIIQQEQCLQELMYAKETNNLTAFSETADECNEIGDKMEAIHLQILQQKVGGEALEARQFD